MKKLSIIFCMLAMNFQNISVDLNEYVKAFNPKQKINKIPIKKVITHDFVGGIKGTKNLSK